MGIRDFCEEEVEFSKSHSNRVKTFYDQDLQRNKFEGASWKTLCEEIVKELPSQVWISFDIDGLDPQLCPHTGTPVPGGLQFAEACYLIRSVALSGRKLIGFDLNEVAPGPDKNNEWDSNVGARLLYKLTAWTLMSQGKAKLR